LKLFIEIEVVNKQPNRIETTHNYYWSSNVSRQYRRFSSISPNPKSPNSEMQLLCGNNSIPPISNYILTLNSFRYRTS